MSIESRAVDILEKHDLKKTNTRIDVLSFFLLRTYALTHGDIETELQDKHDRVTLYRTLNTFEERGITHKVLGEDGVALFALCDDCHIDHHHDRHIHFHCNKCGKTFCIEETYTPDFKMPKGYELEDVKISAKGICKECN